jgi:hypothetical protein
MRKCCSLKNEELKLIVVMFIVIGLTMVTFPESIYASPTTEDDGWVEGDYEGSQEEQEEQAQEDWEDAGRPEEMEDDDDNESDDDNSERDDDNSESDDGLVECEDGSHVESDELCEQSELLVQCSDGSSAATQAECPPVPTATQEQPESELPLPEEQLTCPDGSVVSINEACPPTDKPLSECDGSFQDCISQGGFVCPAGSTAHECELPEPVSREMPDNDCLFNTELPKCAPVDGKCPDGFGTNEDGRCFVIHDKCPDGYHTSEDDEAGECNPNSECTGEAYVLVNDEKSCREKKTWCLENRGADECNQKSPIKKNDNNRDTTKVIKKTTVINRATATASAAATTTSAEVFSCRLDGNAHGIQQKFDIAKYRTCELYPKGPIAYTDGFILGCMQVGNTQQLCQAFVVMNTQQTQTATTQPQTQPNTQSTTQPTQPTQAIQPANVN